MLNWTILAGAGAAIGMFWSQLASFLNRLRSLVIVNVRMEGEAKRAFMYMVQKDFKRSQWGDKYFFGSIQHVIPMNRSQSIGFENLPMQPIIYWKGWRPILLGGVNQANNSPFMVDHIGSMTYIRGTFDLDKLMVRSFDLYNSKNCGGTSQRFFIDKICGDPVAIRSLGQNNNLTAPPETNSKSVEELMSYRILKWQHSEIGIPRLADPFSGYVFPKAIQELIGDIQHWLDSKAWFEEKRIPWKLGILMHSKPGCGKSSLCRALGQYFDLPIFVYDLAYLTNKELSRYWGCMKTSTPCIALIEDIDAVFHERKNIVENGTLTFDCLLNLISGVDLSDGIILIITTNDLSKIDAALGTPDRHGKSTRPGRINKIIELGVMNKSDRHALAQKILSDCPESIDKAVAESENYTPAQTQELFSKIALDHYWNHR